MMIPNAETSSFVSSQHSHKLRPAPPLLPPNGLISRDLELIQSIIHHITTKSSSCPKQGRVTESRRHVLHPFVVLVISALHVTRQPRRKRKGGYLWVARMSRMVRILCLLGHGLGVELLGWVGVVAGIDVA